MIAPPIALSIPVEAEPQVVVFAAPPPTPLPLLAPAAPPDAPPKLPDQVRAVIDAAIDSNDEGAVAAVIKYAKATNPDTATQIDAIDTAWLAKVAERKAKAEADRRRSVLAAGPLDLWKGTAELGGSRSTGNTDTLAVYGALALERDGIAWRHKLTARVDFQRTDGDTTADRSLLAWQPNYKIDERLYAYGLTQFDRDRFVGIRDRFTAGAGLGYSVLTRPNLKLDLEGGPAVRYTDFVEAGREATLAARGSLAFKWQVNPSFAIGQDASMFVERGQSNATATTAFDAKLFGPLTARLSYNILYQRDVADDREPVDTISRASLVYTF